ncbi:YbaK/EbsC family protein [Streptococcus sp. NLN76]|uniref:YbaK/EbsC family protein n=1 Tax=Streptococcus sp. NLN76 TaxID=2822800 RepID=UPI0018AA52BA|nr:YbaK/EbsC family protein [Streptococcus sp. NLN76]MBF8970020.1 proline--tRNA ligase [Streptococcus sp. NLN76]
MNLDFKQASEGKELLPTSVWESIVNLNATQEIQVAEINPDFADGESLNREYGVPFEQEANCLVLEGKRGDEKKYAALLIPYGKKANTNATVKRPLDVAKVGFAPLDFILEQTGMEFGAITPIGLPETWSILIDQQILEQDSIIVGGGLVQSKLLVPTKLLTQLPNVQVIEGLAKD